MQNGAIESPCWGEATRSPQFRPLEEHLNIFNEQHWTESKLLEDILRFAVKLLGVPDCVLSCFKPLSFSRLTL